jgi:hypothetical protein
VWWGGKTLPFLGDAFFSFFFRLLLPSHDHDQLKSLKGPKKVLVRFFEIRIAVECKRIEPPVPDRRCTERDPLVMGVT